jgi:hypothetical protein
MKMLVLTVIIDLTQLEVVAQLLLVFIARILCMSAACLSDLPPSKAPYVPTSAVKDALVPAPAAGSPVSKNPLESKSQNSVNIASPVKRVLKAVGERRSQPQSESPVSGVSESDESSISAGINKVKKRDGGVGALGTYAHLPEIVRLHDALRGIYDNFKVRRLQRNSRTK